jgi:hypothetical protein
MSADRHASDQRNQEKSRCTLFHRRFLGKLTAPEALSMAAAGNWQRIGCFDFRSERGAMPDRRGGNCSMASDSGLRLISWMNPPLMLRRKCWNYAQDAAVKSKPTVKTLE